MDIAYTAQTRRIEMPGKVRHVISDTELLRYIGLFRKKEPVWLKDAETTKQLKKRLKHAVGLTYMKQNPDQF